MQINAPKHFDKELFLKRMDWDQDATEAVLKQTKAALNKMIDDFQATVDSLDIANIHKKAHKIKGTARSLSFEILADKAFELERFTENGEIEKITAGEVSDFIKNQASGIVEEMRYLKQIL
jgi:HPt (histidine-containing phosphotransfer) domain-containing protein